MALKNLFGWNHASHAAPASACGSACGAGDPKPTEEPKPSACGSAWGAGYPILCPAPVGFFRWGALPKDRKPHFSF